MRVIPVPCLSDNYAYLVVQGGLAAVVDPSEADPVLRALDEHALELSEIWLTHHHPNLPCQMRLQLCVGSETS